MNNTLKIGNYVIVVDYKKNMMSTVFPDVVVSGKIVDIQDELITVITTIGKNKISYTYKDYIFEVIPFANLVKFESAKHNRLIGVYDEEVSKARLTLHEKHSNLNKHKEILAMVVSLKESDYDTFLNQ